MKEKLYDLYKSRQDDFRNIVSEFPGKDMAGPFLMSPNEKYSLQNKPLLFVGRETYGWTYEIEDIKKQMTRYEDFNLGLGYLASPFWNIMRKTETALGNELYSTAWSNFSKFDFYAGSSSGKYEEKISSVDNLIVDEIKIIQPKVCLFFTGPSFDVRIKRVFHNVVFKDIETWKGRQLSKLEHPDLPLLTFRTYHPKSLRLQKIETKFIQFLSTLSS